VKASLHELQSIMHNRDQVIKGLEAKEVEVQAKRESMQSQVQQIENLHKQIEMYSLLLPPPSFYILM
jgi:hypothetical protein